MKNMCSVTQKRMPQHPGLYPLRTFQRCKDLSMIASSTSCLFCASVFPTRTCR